METLEGDIDWETGLLSRTRHISFTFFKKKCITFTMAPPITFSKTYNADDIYPTLSCVQPNNAVSYSLMFAQFYLLSELTLRKMIWPLLLTRQTKRFFHFGPSLSLFV